MLWIVKTKTQELVSTLSWKVEYTQLDTIEVVLRLPLSKLH